MLVPPVWANEQVNLNHSLVVELDRAWGHSSVVVVVAQSSAEKGVKLFDPWLELIWLAEYFVSSYICNSAPGPLNSMNPSWTHKMHECLLTSGIDD